jgi:phospholipid/cholesterol/gamma-HCH transport system substrate-binding protein
MAVSTEVKVGAFVLAGLAVVGLTVFMIGDSDRLFEGKATYFTSFEDVEGLSNGAPVLMGGVNIGHVESVEYPEDEKRSEVVVSLAIVRSEARRIRQDSTAAIAPKGLLGDKLITISKGSIGEPQMPEDSMIPSQVSGGLFAQIEGLGEKVDSVLGNIEKTSGTLAREEFRDDIEVTMKSLRNFAESLDQGEGYVPMLIRDKQEAENLSKTVAELRRTATQLSQILRGVNQTVDRVNEGPGLVHEVIYGQEGAKAAQQIGNAADELALTLKGIREGDGIARNILYGGGDDTNAEKAMANLAAITEDLKDMVADVKQGKGTLGALVVDPSVYEDMKVLLGNVQRNEVLRALVRYSIKRDEKGGPHVTDDKAPSAGAQLQAGAETP